MTLVPIDEPRVALPVAQLDVLELVRKGALPSYPLGRSPGTVTLPLPLTWHQGPPRGEVEATDLEGVPVARMRWLSGPSGPLSQGVPVWLSERSSRPFEDWHIGPGSLTEHTGLVVLRPAVDPAELLAALRRAGERPLILLLTSLDGDAPPEALDAARQARAALHDHPGSLVAVAPVPASLPQAEQNAVINSYARGRPIIAPEPAASPGDEPRTVVFFTGLSGSGKSTLARTVRNRLVEDGHRVTLLDGDVVRRHLSAGLGFSAADRDTNVRRIGWVAAEIAYHGGIAVCCPIAPFEHTRQQVREMVESRGGRFVLVHVATPLSECERRDRKGLYARARRGEIADFTGISSPYEEPPAPDLRVDTTGRDVKELADDVLGLMDAGARC